MHLRTKFQVSKQIPKEPTKIWVKWFQVNGLLSQPNKLANIFAKLPAPTPRIFVISTDLQVELKNCKFAKTCGLLLRNCNNNKMESRVFFWNQRKIFGFVYIGLHYY